MFTYTLTRAQLEAKRAEALAKYKLTIPGDQGMVTYDNVTVGFRYIETEALLRVAVIKKPFPLSIDTVNAALQSALAV